MPRTVCKREITREEAEHYLREGKTELLTDFTSRFGRPFSATLVLKDTGRHGFEFPPRKRAGEEEGAGANGADAAAPAAVAADAPAAPKRPRAKKAPAKKAAAEARPRCCEGRAQEDSAQEIARARRLPRRRSPPRARSERRERVVWTIVIRSPAPDAR